MSRKLLIPLAALGVAAAALAAAWPRRAETLAAQPGAPPVFLALDRGWITGQTQLRVRSAPQALAWPLGNKIPVWAAEMGFIVSAALDAEGGRLVVLEQRKEGLASLHGLEYAADDVYPPDKDWPLYMTQVELATGRILARQRIDILDLPKGVFYSAAWQLHSVRGERLFLYSLTERDLLMVYDLERNRFVDQNWELCEGGFAVRVELTPAADEAYALCHNYTTGMQAWVAGLSLPDGAAWRADIPALGKEDYMVGNGLVLTLDGRLLVLDTDAGALAEVDLAARALGQPVQYRAEAKAQARPWWEAWLGVRDASAKRWFAFSALSPDGRWLAVDDGIRDGHDLRFWLIDLASLKAVSSVEVTGYPFTAVFDNENVLWIVTEKRNPNQLTPLVRFDPASGVRGEVLAELGAWPSDLFVLP
jgi:hypothetical protein